MFCAGRAAPSEGRRLVSHHPPRSSEKAEACAELYRRGDTTRQIRAKCGWSISRVRAHLQMVLSPYEFRPVGGSGMGRAERIAYSKRQRRLDTMVYDGMDLTT